MGGGLRSNRPLGLAGAGLNILPRLGTTVDAQCDVPKLWIQQLHAWSSELWHIPPHLNEPFEVSYIHFKKFLCVVIR